MSELVFFRRGEEVLRFSLDAPRVVLGRGEQCDVVIPDPEVSRQQVALVREGPGFVIEDLSGKGTVLSGQKVTRAPLLDGTDLTLGQWRALFRSRSASGPLEPATELGDRTEIARQPEGPPGRAAVQVRIKYGTKESVQRLQADTFTVGKDAGCDLALDHRYLSARHLKVTRQEHRFHVVDQHSTNGTWVGALRVFEADVPFFTTLKVGETELTLEPAGLSGPKGVANFEGLIGNDASIRQLAELIERVAPSTAAVTVLGESGTGKELVAHALHRRSSRADQPFIPVNCAAISKDLIESELFGHEKGAFTGAAASRKGAFEEADGGTIFLDEIGELPLDLQAKLLRVLESGEVKPVGASRPLTVDVRIVAATNRDLLTVSREGKFREDLYYRLCVVPVHLPPLRSRMGDVVPLAEHFLARFVPRGQTVPLTGEAMAKLKGHGWPGNVRELRNVIHRALLLRAGACIDGKDISFDTGSGGDGPRVSLDYVPGSTMDAMLERYERQMIEQALRFHGNNREKAAQALGIPRSTFFKRLREWGLTQEA